MLVNPVQGGPLCLALGDNPLSRLAVVDAALTAEVVQPLAAADAQLRLEGAGAVVEPRVDDLAITRRGLGAELGVALEEEGGRTGGEGGCCCKADNAGAYDLGKGLAVRSGEQAAPRRERLRCSGEAGVGAMAAVFPTAKDSSYMTDV